MSCSTCTPATGATIVFVTHDLDEAIYLSDRVARPHRHARHDRRQSLPTELPRPRDQLATRALPGYMQVAARSRAGVARGR